MFTSVLTEKGQTTIPKSVRDHLGLKVKHRIVYVPQADGRVYMVCVKGNILDAAGAFKKNGRKPIDFRVLRDQTKNLVTKNIIKNSK